MISFVVATYNRPAPLAGMLWSLVAQTDPDWECVVMDEGENAALVEGIGDLRIRRVPHPRVELSGDGRGSLGLLAKHAGIQHVAGDRLCFLSDDLYLMPSFVAEVKKRGEDIVGVDEVYGYAGYRVLLFAPRVGFCNCNYVIRRDTYLAHPFTDFMESREQLGIADGLVPQACANAGATHHRIPAVLMVHNP